MTITCVHCQQRYVVNSSFTQARCKRCGAVVRRDPPASPFAGLHQPAKPTRKRWLWYASAVGIAGFFMLATGVAYLGLQTGMLSSDKSTVLAYLKSKSRNEIRPIQWGEPKRAKGGVVMHLRYEEKVGLEKMRGEAVFLLRKGKVVDWEELEPYMIRANGYEHTLNNAIEFLGTQDKDFTGK